MPENRQAVLADAHDAHDAYDVVVIGAGLLGCFTARELSRYRLRVALVEAREDVCTGISRANTAIVYSGYDNKPSTLKAQMCVAANRDFARLCAELGVPIKACGSLMVAFGPNGEAVLQRKLRQGAANGVEALRLLTAAEVIRAEPNINPAVRAALFSPNTATVNPWELCIAAAENAISNGVELRLASRVVGIKG
ncbi:MAG: FAD-dependent oxidoreductase, partial [Coriobacteriales bacterium]|nr:FAD-dependent oxidoreductase [Coriobacteriales bacterium]